MKISICTLADRGGGDRDVKEVGEQGCDGEGHHTDDDALAEGQLGRGRPSATNDALRSCTPAGISETTKPKLRTAASAENLVW